MQKARGEVESTKGEGGRGTRRGRQRGGREPMLWGGGIVKRVGSESNHLALYPGFATYDLEKLPKLSASSPRTQGQYLSAS